MYKKPNNYYKSYTISSNQYITYSKSNYYSNFSSTKKKMFKEKNKFK